MGERRYPDDNVPKGEIVTDVSVQLPEPQRISLVVWRIDRMWKLASSPDRPGLALHQSPKVN